MIRLQDKDWPCPMAEDIAPCTCSYYNNTFLFQIWVHIVIHTMENELIYTNICLDTVALILQDPEIWDNAKPMSLPVDIFNGKSFRNIWISLKVDHVDADAFLSSHETVEELYLSGPGWVDGVMPLRM